MIRFVGTRFVFLQSIPSATVTQGEGTVTTVRDSKLNRC